jgi:type I restriction enzyme R subunit
MSHQSSHIRKQLNQAIDWFEVCACQNSGWRRFSFQPKSQLEVFNETTFTAKEFDAVLNHLAKGNVLKSQNTQDRFQLTKEDGTSFYVRFFNTEDNKEFISSYQSNSLKEVTRTVMMSLLVNGLPLVQIELKRSGIEIKEALTKSIATKALFLEQSRFVSIRAIVCDKQWRQYQIFNKRNRSNKPFFWADANNKTH